MKMTKDEIDVMSYETMLRLNRFEPLGAELFMGEYGKYFSDSMIKKRKEVGDAEHTRISKEIGWGNDERF